MNEVLLFPISDYWIFYLLFSVFVLAVLALDQGAKHLLVQKWFT